MEYAAKGQTSDHLIAVRSLRRYKRTPEYRAQLQTEELRSRLNAKQATTDLGKRRARLREFECRAELACLRQGDEPSAFSGLIRFPTRED